MEAKEQSDTAGQSLGERDFSLNNTDFLTGAKVGLCFLVGFFLLGYSPLVSVILGIIGGMAGGWILVAHNDEAGLSDPLDVDKVQGQKTSDLQFQNSESWANPFVKNTRGSQMWNKSPSSQGLDSFSRGSEEEKEEE